MQLQKFHWPILSRRRFSPGGTYIVVRRHQCQRILPEIRRECGVKANDTPPPLLCPGRGGKKRKTEGTRPGNSDLQAFFECSVDFLTSSGIFCMQRKKVETGRLGNKRYMELWTQVILQTRGLSCEAVGGRIHDSRGWRDAVGSLTPRPGPAGGEGGKARWTPTWTEKTDQHNAPTSLTSTRCAVRFEYVLRGVSHCCGIVQ